MNSNVPSKDKSYLGDGVYADIENGMIKLTTENGISATNTIYLEMEVFDALTKYVNRKEEEYAKKREENRSGAGDSHEP